MPRTAQFTKEDIASKALDIIREKGPDALSARTLGSALGCSSRPVFTVFKNMEEVNCFTRELAGRRFADYVSDVTDYIPAFKEFGMRLFRFAREEQNLFRYLFLHKDAANDGIHPKAQECLREICRNYGISDDQSALLFRQMWTFACGLALLSSKEADAYPEELVSEMISLQFASTLKFIQSGQKLVVITPHRRSEGESMTIVL